MMTTDETLRYHLHKVFTAPSDHTRLLFAKLFVREWAVSAGVDLERRDGAIIWCKR